MAFTELSIKVKVDICPPGFRYRTNWRGKLILQRMDEDTITGPHGYNTYEASWRDATVSDLTQFITTERIQ